MQEVEFKKNRSRRLDVLPRKTLNNARELEFEDIKQEDVGSN